MPFIMHELSDMSILWWDGVLAHAIMAHVIMVQFTIKCHNGALTECCIVKFSSHYDTLAHAFSMAHCYKIDSVWGIVLRWRIP